MSISGKIEGKPVKTEVVLLDTEGNKLIRREYVDGALACIHYERMAYLYPTRYRAFYIIYDPVLNTLERYITTDGVTGDLCGAETRCSGGVLPLEAVKGGDMLLEQLKNIKTIEDCNRLWKTIADMLNAAEEELDWLEGIEKDPPDVEMEDLELELDREEDYYE